MLVANAVDTFQAVRPSPAAFVDAHQVLGPVRTKRIWDVADLLPPIGALLPLQRRVRVVDGNAGGGGGDGGGGGGGSPVGWTRSQSGKHFLLALAVVLAVLLAGATPGSQKKVAGPLAWSEELLTHLAGLAAEWDVPIASAYLRILVRAASSRRELCQAVDTILLAEDEREAAGLGGADEALLLASAVACVALSDLICRDMIPKIIDYREEQLHWAGRVEPQWRLALESFSLPLGPALAARFPRRSLAHRVHDYKVLERAAQSQAAAAAETLGRLHHALTNLAAAQDTHHLQASLDHFAHLYASLQAQGDGGSGGGGQRADQTPGATPPSSGYVILERLRRSMTHPTAAPPANSSSSSAGHPAWRGGAGKDGDGNGDGGGDVLYLTYPRYNRFFSVRRWPEATMLVAVLASSPVRTIFLDPAVGPKMMRQVQDFARQSWAGACKIFTDHLQGPLEHIAKALFDKPTTAPIRLGVEESKKVLHQMIDSFNADVTRSPGGGMQAVMQAYAEEIRTPVRSALSGKLFRAGLIQVQEIKVNLEAEFVTLQRLLEAQQLNLQALAMLPALFASFTAYEVLRFVASLPFTSDPLRPQLDIESLLNTIGREVIAEKTAAHGSPAAFRARGCRCLYSWQATQLLKTQRVGNLLGGSREEAQVRLDVARLASLELPVEHVPLMLDVVFRQLRR
jgi:hypothetical protein